jgi:antitoxin HicB
MKKHYYPTVFQPEEVGYSVWLADIDGAISQGDTLEEAIENIKDAFGLYVEEAHELKSELPKASNPADITLEKGQFVCLIEFDWVEYQRKHGNKAVKKTLTIPAWLNTLAEEEQINFSGVLQDALKAKLELKI